MTRDRYVTECDRIIAELRENENPDALREWMRLMVRSDIFFLGVYVCEREDLNRDWLFERCKEVQDNPDGYIDIWAREHYKDLACDTPILTPNGWKKHGDLEVGDYVFTPKGMSRVVATRHFTDSHCMKVQFRGNQEIVCGAGHLWKVMKWNSARVNGDQRVGWESVVCETSELMSSYKHPYIPAFTSQKQSKNWYIQSVEEHETVPTNCIQIEDPEGIYLAGYSLIPTHNSTIITWLKTMQDILINPEERICIYSFNQTLAKSFVNQVKTEFETNWRLKWLFPEILWEDPLKGTYLDENNVRQRIPWTTDSIRVKRKSRAKEDTLTASGLVTGQKTGGHYTILIYDDVVTLDSVTSAEMIDRTTKAYEMSLNTGSSSGGKPTRVRIIGTRYHYADTYSEILKRKSAKARIYPCVDEKGYPVLLTKEILADKKKDLGSWVFASQMMCDPRQAGSMGFKREWIKPWTPTIWENLNRVIVVDPADKIKRKSDYTVMWVIGLGADRNYYIIDLIRDKLSLTGRTNALFALHQKYRPNLGVHYESVGMQADTQHIEEQMELRNYRFPLYPVKATVAKGLRIEALEPLFRNHRVYMPDAIWWKNWEGETVNLMEQFILEEFLAYPFCSHDDMLDGLSKIVDEQVVPFLYFPEPITAEELLKQRLGIPTDYEEPYEPF